MFYKFLQTIRKELLLLRRDVGGLLILFLMPLALIITITLIQSATFESISGSRISLVLVDNDRGEIADSVIQNIRRSKAFDLVMELNGRPVTKKQAKDLVFSGTYQLAIVIPEHLSDDLNQKIDENVRSVLSGFGMETKAQENASPVKNKIVSIYFDPVSQVSFRNTIKAEIDKLITAIERDKVYSSFQKQLDIEEISFEKENFIRFNEILPQQDGQTTVLPNASQHNVPAWSLFGIFFIIIPLSINIVKEKNQGTFLRLRTNPTPYWLIILGKTFTYLLVTLTQFYLMVIVGKHLFPLIGLPSFETGANFFSLSVIALFAGLAAIGLGILIGTIAKTQEQSAPLGATLVVLLAAIGGVWVPVFVMPPFMQVISNISPMNWALYAFYDVILRNVPFKSIIGAILLLLLFALVTISAAVIYDKKKRSV